MTDEEISTIPLHTTQYPAQNPAGQDPEATTDGRRKGALNPYLDYVEAKIASETVPEPE